MITKNIHDARPAEIKVLSPTSAEFTIAPLYPGYGYTLGNSLRRVLLSSIKGSAIVAFSIEGTNHEFTTIPGIREDVVDIMLNLKNIRFKCHDDQPIELSLEIKGSDQSEKDGEKRVVAGDIKLPAGVEIANPNQVILHIDDPDYVLRMRFVVDSGRGYLTTADSAESRLHSDMIAIDALFTPVLRVRYKVENTRVGQDTNLQALTLTVDTDGTITPEDAFEEAAAILVNQYTALAAGKEVESAPAPGGEDKSNIDDERLVEDLGFSSRTTNALINNNIKNIAALRLLGVPGLRVLKGFGSKALDEVTDKMTELGIDISEPRK